MSQSDSSRASWENGIATRRDHVGNLLTHRSAQCPATRLSNGVRAPTVPPPPPHPRPPVALPSDAIPPENAKDPVVILVLALFLGGISYVVLGQWQKGLAGIAVWVCGVVLSVLTCGIGSILMLPVAVLLVIDAYSQAKTLREGRPIGHWTFFSRAL